MYVHYSLTDVRFKGCTVLKPDLEIVPLVNQDGRCWYSQQSFMTNGVVGKEELLILLAAVMFCVH